MKVSTFVSVRCWRVFKPGTVILSHAHHHPYGNEQQSHQSMWSAVIRYYECVRHQHHDWGISTPRPLQSMRDQQQLTNHTKTRVKLLGNGCHLADVFWYRWSNCTLNPNSATWALMRLPVTFKRKSSAKLILLIIFLISVLSQGSFKVSIKSQ